MRGGLCIIHCHTLTLVSHCQRSLEEPTYMATRCKSVVAASKNRLKVAVGEVAVGGSTERILYGMSALWLLYYR